MKVTVLGCGASSGVPVIGCECGVCRSSNPRNKRMRVSVFVEYDDGTKLLVDTSPDLRQQALSNNIKDVDAIFYTHEHADHVHGMDDVRPFNIRRNGEIDLYASPATMADLKHRFDYLLQPHGGGYWTRAALTPHVVEPGTCIALTPQAQVQTFRQLHGKSESLGLRFGNVVYSTDTNALPEESHPYLQDIDVWIIDCLRDGMAGSHANLETALAWVEQFRPRHAILTHMNHELDYDRLCARLPQHVRPGYDGMTIEVTAAGICISD